MHYGWLYGASGWWMGGWMLLFVVGISLVGVAFIAWVGRSERGKEGKAKQILDQRFARGEIEADEYDRRRMVLR